MSISKEFVCYITVICLYPYSFFFVFDSVNIINEKIVQNKKKNDMEMFTAVVVNNLLNMFQNQKMLPIPLYVLKTIYNAWKKNSNHILFTLGIVTVCQNWFKYKNNDLSIYANVRIKRNAFWWTDDYNAVNLLEFI